MIAEANFILTHIIIIIIVTVNIVILLLVIIILIIILITINGDNEWWLNRLHSHVGSSLVAQSELVKQPAETKIWATHTNQDLFWENLRRINLCAHISIGAIRISKTINCP